MTTQDLAPFQPIGERPRWQMIFDALDKLEIGDVLTYEALDEVLGCDFRPARPGWGRALRELEERNSRTMVAVPSVGYRVVQPSEHRELVLGHSRRSSRQLGRAKQRAAATDRALLDPSDAAYMDRVEMAIGQTQMVVAAVAKRVARHEELIATAATKAEQAESIAVDVSGRVMKIEKAIERAGITVEGDENA